jgi:hypothetical protein
MQDPTKVIDAQVEKFSKLVKSRVAEWLKAHRPDAFHKTELEIHEACRSLADDITEVVLQSTLADPEFQGETARALRSSGQKYRDVGRREVSVTLLGGKKTRVRVEYFRRDLRGRPGPKRKHGRRGKSGTGLFPALAALGIWFMTTPALASEVSRQVADSDSVRTARSALKRRGIELGHEKTLNLVNKVSQRAIAQRNDWLEKMRTVPAKEGPLSGKRVVIATDGGRLRERRSSKGGRKRAKTGHRGYQTPWREPKLLVIYAINDEGKQTDAFRPVYDGTMQDCEATFDMLVGYLRGLGAHEAKDLIVVGDGAKWIWERVDDLCSKVDIDRTKVTEVIDWYHAVEKLHEIAKIPAKWSQKQRDKWSRKAKKLLYAGKIDELDSFIKQLAVGRRGKSVRKHLKYFSRNKARMQYKTFEEAGIPCGSGAVESAIRRIVNLRLKGNAKFWIEANAEGMLLLRSYLKAERFDDLMRWSLLQAVPWWKPDSLLQSPVEAS